MKPKHRFGIELLFFLIVLTLSVNAVGIRPASTELSYDLTKQYNATIWVVNNDKISFNAEIKVEGEMSKYVNLQTANLLFQPETEYLPLNFEINLDENIPPGTHYAYITIAQDLLTSEKDVVYSKLILKHKIVIFGEYPDKYIKTDVDYTDLGDKIKIVSEIENLGKEPLNQVYTTFNIQGNSNQSLPNLTTSTSALSSQENTQLSTEVQKKSLGEGEFIVSATTYYDDLEVEVSKKMIIGKPEIDITYFDKYFLSGEINKYTLELLNQWNQQIENVYVDINLLKDNRSVDQFRTRSVDISKFSRKQIQDYLDAREQSPGKYWFEMTVNYWNTYKMDKKTFTSEFLTESQYKSLKPASNLAGEAYGNENSKNSDSVYYSKNNSFTIIILIILIIIMFLIGVYITYRYIHREEYE